MATARTKQRERDALAVGGAVILHAALMAGLYYAAKFGTPEVPPKPKSIEVSIAEEVGSETTSLNEDTAASPAPELGEPEPAPFVEPEPAPVAEPTPAPVATQAPKPSPRPTPTPKPVVKPKQAQTPQAKPAAKPQQSQPKKQAAAKPQNAVPAKKPGSPTGQNKPCTTAFCKNFSAPGKGQGTNANATKPGKSTGGPTAAEARRSIKLAIDGEIAGPWNRNIPSGADVEKLVTVVQFRLNKDGTLAGEPRLVSQSGKTASNAPQQQLHLERAIRSIKQAAPFKLPAEYYDQWKVWTFTFKGRI